jgi:hypothetical protein
MASEGGISRFDPRKEKEANNPSPIYFSRLQVAGEEVRLAESGAESIPPRELASTQITDHYVAPTYQNVNELMYQYKLEGVTKRERANAGAFRYRKFGGAVSLSGSRRRRIASRVRSQPSGVSHSAANLLRWWL